MFELVFMIKNDHNKIPTALSMFSVSENTERLVWIHTVLRLGMLEIKDGGHYPNQDRGGG